MTSSSMQRPADTLPTGAGHASLRWRAAWPTLLIGLLVTTLFFVWEGRQGFNLADESYLWYGAQRVLAGEVPILDFQAYDPGRYYATALPMRLAGSDSLMAMRYILLGVKILAMGAALSCVSLQKPVRGRYAFALLAALVLVSWMEPLFKIYDILMSIALVCALYNQLRRPSSTTSFVSGVVVGLVAYVGRNHGVYGAMAALGVFAYLAIHCTNGRQWWREVFCFVAGGFVGYLPMFLTMLLVHGFTAAFIDSIKFLFEIKSTNLPLPIPWPWMSPFWHDPSWKAFGQLLTGVFFVSTLIFGVSGIAFAFVQRWRGRPVHPLLAASALCALPYAHYAFSRADSGHLALGIFPTLIGLLTLMAYARTWLRLTAASVLLAASLVAMLPVHPGWVCMGARNCPLIQVGADRVRAEHYVVDAVTLYQRLKHDFAPDGQNYFVTPMHPGAYAMYGTRSPTWEIYTAWPRTAAFQQSEIARLAAAKPAFIVVFDFSLDGHDELRYEHTHPLMDQYIRENYVPVQGYTNDTAYRVYKPR